MAIAGLHSFGLEVPDLEIGKDYYESFGLSTHENDSWIVAACDGREQDQIVISEAPVKRLSWVAFSVEPGTLAEMTSSLEKAGNERIDGPKSGGEGEWFRDPDGLSVRLSEGPLAAPRSFEHRERNFDGDHVRIDEPLWLEVRGAAAPRPRRLGHVIKYSPDLDRAEAFYMGALGLRLAESLEGRLSFWNAGAGDHHIFGVSASSAPGLHHCSFEVADIDEIALGARNMTERGHPEQWGLGRHTFGSNLFVYVKDPWGSWAEYFADMDQVTDAWEGRRWKPGEAGSAVWGPAMPSDFHSNLEEPA